MLVRLLAAGLVVAAVSAAATGAAPKRLTCLGQRVTIAGTNRSEVLRGTKGPDVISARGGADVVFAGGGADRVCGGAGRDRIDAGAGNDRIDGGPGLNDAAAYMSATGGVIVDLASGRGEGAGSDRLFRVEWVTGSRFADRLTGSGEANVLDGAEGDDFLTFDGRGSDRYDGGAGSDTISFASATFRVWVNLVDGAVEKPTGVDGVVRLESVIGSPQTDRLVGTAGPNHLDGGGDRDLIWGVAGDDVLLGGDGRDEIYPGAGSDYTDGQEGDDRVSYIWDTPVTLSSMGVDASLAAGRAVDRTGTDVLLSFTGLDGSYGDDRLEGTDGTDWLWGAGGKDRIHGLGGDDYLTGFWYVDGGPGNDYCWTGAATLVNCERAEP